MPSWILKAAVQKAFTVMPGTHFWNQIFQRYVTRSLRLDGDEFRRKIRICQTHLRNYFAERPHKGRPSCFELGTGWYPIVPIGLWLCGASEVHTFDVADLIDSSRIITVARLFREIAESGILPGLLPLASRDRIAILEENCLADLGAWGPDDLLRSFHVVRHFGRIQDLTLGPCSVDLFVSNETLEHVPEDAITACFRRFRKFASPQAKMSHFINLQDHYANYDKTISPYNFLRYSKSMWRLYNNSLHYQNRLRLSEYFALHKNAGWKIVRVEPESGDIDEVRREPIHEEFRRFQIDDLAVKTAWITSVVDEDYSRSPHE